jgi:hypothetical protein
MWADRQDEANSRFFFFWRKFANASNKWLNEKWRLKRNINSPLSNEMDVCRFMNGVCTRLKQCPLHDSWKRSPGVAGYIVIGVRCAHTGLGVGFLGRLPEQHCAWFDWVCVGIAAHVTGSASVGSCYASRLKRNVPDPRCMRTDRNNYLICANCVDASLSHL